MKINETIRKDGLRIISCYIPHRKAIKVELVARVGYAYDPPDKKGLSHCFEHMAFKGTRKRSIKDLQTLGSRNFVYRNASTGVLSTTYKVETIDRKLPLACEYLCDIYFNSVFPKAELEKEKRPIMLEIARNKDSDGALAYQTLLEHLYQENPVRAEGAGTIEGINRIKRSDLIKQKEKWHIPSNTLAIAVGNVKHRDFVREINKRIRQNSRKAPLLNDWSDESEQLPSQKEVVLTRPERKKTILLVGCKIPKGIDDRASEAFSMYSKLIGLPNSRLWNEIREKRGLAYVVEGSYSGFPGVVRIFSVYAEVDPKNLETVKKILWRSLFKPLSEKREFEDLKEIMFDSFEVAAIEHDTDYESLILHKIIENKSVESVEREDKKRLKIIAETTPKDLERVRKEFIRPERFVTVIIEPGKKKQAHHV